jgi:hypothetical protein
MLRKAVGLALAWRHLPEYPQHAVILLLTLKRFKRF